MRNNLKTNDMKKIVLWIVLAVSMLSVADVEAQYSDLYYHQIGDTVLWRAPNGYYQWWEFEQYAQIRRRISAFLSSPMGVTNGKSMMYYFTPDTLKIIGIATSFINPDWVYGAPEDNDEQEYLYIYDAVGDSMVLKSETPWHWGDTNIRHLYLKHYQGGTFPPHRDYEITDANDSCCGPGWYDYINPLHEYYFDTAIYVTDSFYVGASYYSGLMNGEVLAPGERIGLPQFVAYGMEFLRTPCQETEMYTDPDYPISQCSFPFLRYALWSEDPSSPTSPTVNLPYHQWVYRNFPNFLVIYPIVQVDTTVPTPDYCQPIQHFHVALMEDGCVTLAWDDFENYTDYELRYRSMGGVMQQEWVTVMPGTNLFQLCDVDSTTTYYFSVRALCDKRNTAWTEPLIVYIPRPVNGIEEAESEIGRYVSVMPNPATDKVMIKSPMGLRQVEVYNARGILVYSAVAGGQESTIDLTGWAKGSYIANISTAHGTTTKVFVVK